MRFATSVLVLSLLGLGAAGCNAAGSNPLVGKWQATGMSSVTQTDDCVLDWMEFTPKAQTEHFMAVAGNPASSNTVPVTYDTDVSPNMVFVYAYGDNTRGTGYTLLGDGTIRMEDSGRCIYKRAK